MDSTNVILIGEYSDESSLYTSLQEFRRNVWGRFMMTTARSLAPRGSDPVFKYGSAPSKTLQYLFMPKSDSNIKNHHYRRDQIVVQTEDVQYKILYHDGKRLIRVIGHPYSSHSESTVRSSSSIRLVGFKL